MNLPRCPICDRPLHRVAPADEVYRPFCSKRCRTIDLGRWLGESYRIAEDGVRTAPDDVEDDAQG